jgi:hypothetical protein
MRLSVFERLLCLIGIHESDLSDDCPNKLACARCGGDLL